MLKPQRTRLSLIAALLLVACFASSYLAAADPAVNDNGNGTKTVLWDFSNSANYTSSNVAIAPNDLRLGSTPGEKAEADRRRDQHANQAVNQRAPEAQEVLLS